VGLLLTVEERTRRRVRGHVPVLKDDPVVAEELRDWAGVLGSYAPEPFRQL
jgi:hypothetical protein